MSRELDAAWNELLLDALASDGPIRDSDVKEAVARNRPRIEAALLADTPSVEPGCEHEWEVRVSTSGGTVIPSPSRTMGHVAVLPDARWECVKCGVPRVEPAGLTAAEYEAWVQRMAEAHHEDCRLEWQAIAVVDPERMVTQHTVDAHYGHSHDLVRRLFLALLPTQAIDSPEKPT